MNLLFSIRELAERALARKLVLAIFGALFLLFFVLGMCFIKTPYIYSYHLRLCDNFIDRVCYSDRSVIVIFFERTCANILLLVLIMVAGIHVIGLILPPLVLAYRAYTFGGSLLIFFSVYQVSGALVVFVLYLPIHLLIDVILLLGTCLSCSRAPCFRFCRSDALSLLKDFLILAAFIAIVCLAEMILLLVLFHPIGNLL